MCHFHTTVDDHANLLNQKGYDEMSLQNGYSTGHLAGKLEEAFEKTCSSSRGSNELQHFFLETHGCFNHEKDTVHFKFHYQYHPKKEELQLKSLVVRMGEMQKKILFLMKSRNLPVADKVYDILVYDKNTKLAKQIMKSKSQTNQRRLKR
jgi:hypothetical protein